MTFCLEKGKGGLNPFDLIPWEASFHPDIVQDNAHKLKGSTWALCFVGCNGDTEIFKGQEHAGHALLA